jgi:hypothetical protein
MARASRWLGSVVAVASLALAGCIQVHDEAEVTETGSGSFKDTVTIDIAAVEQMAEAMKKAMEELAKGMGAQPEAGMAEAQPPAPEPKLEDDTLEKAKKELAAIPGVELKSATAERKEGKATVTLEATFQTLEGYARATQLEMAAELTKGEDGSWTLTFQTDNDAASDPATPADPNAPADPMSAALEKIEMSRTLKLPGTIVSTNGTQDGSTVRWKMGLAEAKKAGKTITQTVTFKGDDIDLKPFKISRKADLAGGLGAQAAPGAPAPK